MHSTGTLPASCTPQTHAHNKTCHLIFIQQLVCVCVKGRDQQGSGPTGWHLSDSGWRQHPGALRGSPLPSGVVTAYLSDTAGTSSPAALHGALWATPSWLGAFAPAGLSAWNALCCQLPYTLQVSDQMSLPQGTVPDFLDQNGPWILS